jgi:SPP1 gp7 family putative phage head morphogenesis protein
MIHFAFDERTDFRKIWSAARRAEDRFGVQLRKVAQHIADIVRGFDPADAHGSVLMQQALLDYARLIEPWARSVSATMIAEVNTRDKAAWARVSTIMGLEMRAELNTPLQVNVMAGLQDVQTQLITSIPVEAIAKVHLWTQDGLANAERPSEIAKRIYAEIPDVTKAKAMTIARTEVTRTAGTLMRARAESIGSEGYIWRTAHDSDVRPSHRTMEGRFVRWDSPPTLDKMTGHAGCLPNCRCLSLPVLPN